jgi:hypothetical protein
MDHAAQTGLASFAEKKPRRILGARTLGTVVKSGGFSMFTLLRVLSARRILIEQLPALAAAWLIAELFYKFHSFSLEAAAFLATWFVFDGLIQLAKRVIGGRHETAASAGQH